MDDQTSRPARATGEISEVIRPAAIVPEEAARNVLVELALRDVQNGEIVVITPSGIESLRPFPPREPRPCIFEYIYFSRPDSVVHGRSVYEVRKAMGAEHRMKGTDVQLGPVAGPLGRAPEGGRNWEGFR